MPENEDNPTNTSGFGYAGWLVVYLGAVVLASVVYRLGLVRGPNADLIMLSPIALAPFLVRAQTSARARRGISSLALSRHSRRSMAAVLLMVLAIIGTHRFADAADPDPGIALLLTAAVLVPAIGCVWAMATYLAEEKDEFLRHRETSAALFALGFVLICGAVHGSLQLFGLAPAANSLWVLIAWAFGMGFGNLWQWMRGR